MIKKKTESGQILYLIVIAMISLLGFAGLAIDGGRIYSEKRNAQNVADTSAMTTALVIGQSITINDLLIQAAIDAGFNRAASNGYGDTDPNVDHLIITVQRFTDDGLYYLVTVELGSHIDPTFISLVYDGPLAVEVTAVAKVRPIQNLGLGYAMVGANKTDCKSIWVAGTGDMYIEGGDIFANSTAEGCSGVADGGGIVEITDGSIASAGDWDLQGYTTCITDPPNCKYSPFPPEEDQPQVDIKTPPTPVCSSTDFWGSVQINNTSGLPYLLHPGNYGRIRINGDDSVVTFQPGLYCLTQELLIHGGLVTGNRIMFYMINSYVDFSATANITFSAPDYLEDYATPPNIWSGMLIYVSPTNTSPITITGTASSGISGTVFAPSSLCTVIGNGESISISSQFICDKIKLTGSGVIDLTFNEAENYMLPSSIDLYQ